MKLLIELRNEAKSKFRVDVLKFFRKHNKSARVTGAGRFVTLEFELVFPILWSGATFDHPMLKKELRKYEIIVKRFLNSKDVKYIRVEYCV